MASKNDPCDPFPNYVSCEIHLMMIRASMPAKRVGNFESEPPGNTVKKNRRPAKERSTDYNALSLSPMCL